MNRRDFLKCMGTVASCTLAGGRSEAAATQDAGDTYGVLVDTTECIGCRACEEACAEANGLPIPDTDDYSVFRQWRDTSETQWSVVNRFETAEGEEIFVKRQCMHCNAPACASACLTRAMTKTKEGPVIWREDKCLGCRLCMVSCAFEIPKYEYDNPNPRVQKCRLCWDALQEGEEPACVENCGGDALTFGKRSELLEIAKTRIYTNPGSYVSHIYGEHEVGGTGWLYLAAVPFEQLGFRTDLGTTPLPELTREFLYGVPAVLTLVPTLLLGVSKLCEGRAEVAEAAEAAEVVEVAEVGAGGARGA
jgi:Fe-S-cluster-containing dehydrogenase component